MYLFIKHSSFLYSHLLNHWSYKWNIYVTRTKRSWTPSKQLTIIYERWKWHAVKGQILKWPSELEIEKCLLFLLKWRGHLLLFSTTTAIIIPTTKQKQQILFYKLSCQTIFDCPKKKKKKKKKLPPQKKQNNNNKIKTKKNPQQKHNY